MHWPSLFHWEENLTEYSAEIFFYRHKARKSTKKSVTAIIELKNATLADVYSDFQSDDDDKIDASGIWIIYCEVLSPEGSMRTCKLVAHYFAPKGEYWTVYGDSIPHKFPTKNRTPTYNDKHSNM